MGQDLADLLIAVSRSLPLGIHTREQALDLEVDKYHRTLHFIDSQVQQGKVRDAPALDTIFELNLESINTFSPDSVLTPAREIRLYENAANARRKKFEVLRNRISFEEQIEILTEVHGIYSTALQEAE